jgi:hypothetical protein
MTADITKNQKGWLKKVSKLHTIDPKRTTDIYNKDNSGAFSSVEKRKRNWGI